MIKLFSLCLASNQLGSLVVVNPQYRDPVCSKVLFLMVGMVIGILVYYAIFPIIRTIIILPVFLMHCNFVMVSVNFILTFGNVTKGNRTYRQPCP